MRRSIIRALALSEKGARKYSCLSDFIIIIDKHVVHACVLWSLFGWVGGIVQGRSWSQSRPMKAWTNLHLQ